MFAPQRSFKDLVLSYLKHREQSISALTKQLKGDGYKFHRLFVTGYLKALADVGILREKEIPPAKVYSVSSSRERNLYETIGDRCRAASGDERIQVRLAISALQKLFRRPIFLGELREAGFSAAIEAPAAAEEEKEEARRALSKLAVDVPANEPAYAVEERRNEIRDAILMDILIERFGMASLVIGTRQTRLVER